MTHRSDREDHACEAPRQTFALDPIDRVLARAPAQEREIRAHPGRSSEAAAPHVFGVHAGHGYGNAGPVEITKRFPPDLGNLAQNARFPHFHSRLSSVRPENKDQENKDQNTGGGTRRRAVRRLDT